MDQMVKLTKVLPPPSLPVMQAIQDGGKEAKDAAVAAMEAQAKAAPYARFGMLPFMGGLAEYMLTAA